jgi:hypothetical protein
MRGYRGLLAVVLASLLAALLLPPAVADDGEMQVITRPGSGEATQATPPETPAQGPRIVIDGLPAMPGEQVYMLKGDLVGPVRPFLEALGARVTWDARAQEARARRGDVVLGLKYHRPSALRGKKAVKLPRAPWEKAGQMHAPLLPLAEALGCTVSWDARTHVARIATSGAKPVAGAISKTVAMQIAVAYLKKLDEFPDTVTGTTARQGQAPANRYWEALKSGGEMVPNAPTRPCWIVQINYEGLVPDSWKQVYVDQVTREVIGGMQTR